MLGGGGRGPGRDPAGPTCNWSSRLVSTQPAPTSTRGELAGRVQEWRAVDAVAVDGKQFVSGGRRFRFRGVTYGTFAPRADGARFPPTERLRQDLAAMRAAGLTVVRTYTTPTPDLIDAARDQGLRILAGIFYPDWRYLVGSSRREQRRVSAQAHATLRAEARRLRGDSTVLALSIGNEIPADVIRWFGAR